MNMNMNMNEAELTIGNLLDERIEEQRKTMAASGLSQDEIEVEISAMRKRGQEALAVKASLKTLSLADVRILSQVQVCADCKR
jgi:hypothetical protein